jgi:hypothetical protein
MAKKTKTKTKSKPKFTKPKAAKSASKGAAKSKTRTKWLDDKSGAPAIEKYARQLTTFIDALADGEVQDSEVKEQEARLTKLMKDVEPRLDDALHAKVTQLLCELTAYDLMQVLNSVQRARPRARFRG